MSQMSREDHLKVRKRISSEIFRHQDYDCSSSARTRPFSFDEIMQRRKKKELEAAAGEEEMMVRSEKRNFGSAPGHSMLQEGSKSMKDSLISSEKHATQGARKIEFKKEERSKLKQGNDFINGKNFPDDEMSLKRRDKPSRDKVDRNARGEVSIDKLRQYNWKNVDSSRYTYNTELLNRQPNESSFTRNHVDREKVHQRKGKRKHQHNSEERDRSAIDNRASKKHRHVRQGEMDSSEREIQKKVLAESHYGDSKKKRRSRSRDHDRIRRRSHSGSPRAHKEESDHLFKDSSVRDLPNADRRRHGTNGSYSKGYYRKHNDRTSGLGGYSPRKRKSDVAVNTPLPIKKSPEKGSNAWDLPPTEKNSSHAGPSETSIQDLAEAKNLSALRMLTTTHVESKPETVASLKNLLVSNASTIDSVQLTQATRPKRRLYVENLPSSASEKDVMKCLNDFFLLSGTNHIQGTQPCISCIINTEKGQAVVEFLTPEDATSALAFDGKSFSGSIIKVRRPKDFVEASTGISEKSTAIPSVVTVDDAVFNSPHKIFIGGISKAVSSDMLMEIVTSFGVLKAYHFEVNKDVGEPLAFLEFADHSITLKACAGLNGMKLGGRILTVVQANPSASGEEIVADPPLYEVPAHARALLESPTQVLKLLNVFNEESFPLLCETEVEETLEDIRLECARFGTVKSINFVKYNRHYDEYKPITGVVIMNADENLLTNFRGPSTDGETIEQVEQEVTPYDSSVGGSVQDNSLDDSEIQDVTHVESSDGKPLGEDESKDHYEAEQHDSVVRYEEPICTSEQAEKNDVSFVENECVKLDGADKQPVEITDENAAEQMDNSQINLHGFDADQFFEEGCVLIEFLRKEAACSAAHCLHGRLYCDRIVSAAYVPHDLYRARFSGK